MYKLCGSSAGFCLIQCSYVGVFKCNRPGYLGYEKPWKVSPKQHCLINQALVSVMDGYSPLTESVCMDTNGDQPIIVTESSVRRKLCKISCARAGGPGDLPNWVLREFADILAAPVADIHNYSFSKCKVPRAWKIADVPPLPKAPTVNDINKDLRPISLTFDLL